MQGIPGITFCSQQQQFLGGIVNALHICRCNSLAVWAPLSTLKFYSQPKNTRMNPSKWRRSCTKNLSWISWRESKLLESGENGLQECSLCGIKWSHFHLESAASTEQFFSSPTSLNLYFFFAEPKPDANNLMAFNQIFAWKPTWNGAHGSLLRLSWNSIYLNFVAKYRKMVIDILQL